MLYQEKYKIPVLAFSFGVASIVGQVALLREFMSLFSGHEIIIGLFLAFWMLLTGVGAFAGGRLHKKVRSAILPLTLGLASVFSILILYLLRLTLVVHGAEPEFSTLILIIFVTLLPVSVITGYAFTQYSKEVSGNAGSWSISKIYVWEQLGSSVGGGLLYLLLVRWFDSVRIIEVVVLWLFIVAVMFSDMHTGRKNLGIALLLLFGTVMLIVPFQKMLRGLEFESEKIVKIKDTPYGNVIVTTSSNQINIYENGNLRGYGGDVEQTEESVHAVMSRHPSPHNVLMIGGASQGTFKEFEKYKNVDVDYVEIDPAIAELLQEEKSRHVRFFITDPFRYLKNTNKKYDVIIMNNGLPHNLQDNRFFTVEFFHLAKKHLTEYGILGVKGSVKQFHKEDNYIRLLSIIASTGMTVFDVCDIFPGNNIWFVFSNKKVLPLFDEQYAYIFKQNIWFNPNYILSDLTEGESEAYLKEINLNMPVNSCLMPVLFDQSITTKTGYWHINRYVYIFVIAVILFVAILFFKRRVKIVAAAGFALAGVQLLLIYMMQIVAGNVYEVIGVLFALSMAGMALGGWMHRRIIFRWQVSSETFLLITGVMILLLPLVFRMIVAGSIPYLFQTIIVYLLVLIFSFFGGVIFSGISYNTEVEMGRHAGSVYGADLIGSSGGVLLTSLFFIPVAGMSNTAFILGLFSLMFALSILIRKL